MRRALRRSAVWGPCGVPSSEAPLTGGRASLHGGRWSSARHGDLGCHSASSLDHHGGTTDSDSGSDSGSDCGGDNHDHDGLGCHTVAEGHCEAGETDVHADGCHGQSSDPVQSGDDDDGPTEGASLAPDLLDCSESGHHSHPSNMSCHPRAGSHCQDGEDEHMGDGEWIGCHPRSSRHVGPVDHLFGRDLVNLICYRDASLSPILAAGCAAAMTHDLECANGDHAHPGNVVCHSDGIDHDGCAHSTGDGATSSHFHAAGTGAHRDCQRHSEPACKALVPVSYDPGPPHPSRLLPPCPVSVGRVGVEDPTTLEWNPLDGTVCKYASRQGFSGASARTLCMRHHNVTTFEWEGDYDLEAALAAADDNLWDDIKREVWALLNEDVVRTGVIFANPTVGLGLSRLPSHVEDEICAPLAWGIGQIAEAHAQGAKFVKFAKGTAADLGWEIYCRIVIPDEE